MKSIMWTAVLLWAVVLSNGASLAQPPAPTNSSAQKLLAKAQRADGQGDWKAAKRWCDEALKLEEDLASAFYFRGRASFCLGEFAKSVKDFDRYIQLRPQVASRQWERGIACYYAGQFEAGAKQFELYQTYHDNDVENSVWRYLCMARAKGVGVEKARSTLLPIRNDRRVGMMKVLDLFREKATVDELLKIVTPKTKDASTGPLFYARLYIGLHHEANGRHAEARKFISLAAKEHKKDADEGRVNHYMYEVAAVHDRVLREAAP